MGWGWLVEEPVRCYVAGASSQPWQADVVFTPVPPDHWATYAEPDRVRAAWSIEAELIDPEHTRFATETRVVATDDAGRAKFRRYWRKFGKGIVLIRPDCGQRALGERSASWPQALSHPARV